MSARHRHVKRRIRELGYFEQNALEAIAAYRRVLRDCSGLGDLSLIERRLAFWEQRFIECRDERAREEELLAQMPKSLRGENYDPGDEQAYRDRRKGEGA